MTSKIVNLSNGHRYKFNQAKRLVDNQCVLAWVQYGVSVRELTVDEMVKARSEQAKRQEPLPYKEIHGLRYEPSVNGLEATRREGLLAFQAHQFIAEVRGVSYPPSIFGARVQAVERRLCFQNAA